MGDFLVKYLFLYVYLILRSSSFFFSESSNLSPYCKLRKQFHLNGMHKAGDVILGGLFEVHYTSIFPELIFITEPHQPSCQG